MATDHEVVGCEVRPWSWESKVISLELATLLTLEREFWGTVGSSQDIVLWPWSTLVLSKRISITGAKSGSEVTVVSVSGRIVSEN
jgi:hypothetical protein